MNSFNRCSQADYNRGSSLLAYRLFNMFVKFFNAFFSVIILCPNANYSNYRYVVLFTCVNVVKHYVSLMFDMAYNITQQLFSHNSCNINCLGEVIPSVSAHHQTEDRGTRAASHQNGLYLGRCWHQPDGSICKDPSWKYVYCHGNRPVLEVCLCKAS